MKIGQVLFSDSPVSTCHLRTKCEVCNVFGFEIFRFLLVILSDSHYGNSNTDNDKFNGSWLTPIVIIKRQHNNKSIQFILGLWQLNFIPKFKFRRNIRIFHVNFIEMFQQKNFVGYSDYFHIKMEALCYTLNFWRLWCAQNLRNIC